MATRNLTEQSKIVALATDLDGTFLPLNGKEPHVQAMRCLGEHFTTEGRKLIFVTGRHYASVREAMAATGAPWPSWILCDVGTSLYCPAGTNGNYAEVPAFREHLDALTRDLPLSELEPLVTGLDGLRRQEPEKQGAHKLSYYTLGAELDQRVAAVEALIQQHAAPFSVIGSIDPFNDDGLIDILPRGVNKAYALEWLGNEAGIPRDAMIFAGDSGNDLAALTSGANAVLVGNATDRVKNEARRRMNDLGMSERLYISRAASTSGVLEGCAHFGVTLCPAR